MIDTSHDTVKDFLNLNGLPHDGEHLVPSYTMLLLSILYPDMESFERKLHGQMFESALYSILLFPEENEPKEMPNRILWRAKLLMANLEDSQVESEFTVEDICWHILRYRMLIVQNFCIPASAYDQYVVA